MHAVGALRNNACVAHVDDNARVVDVSLCVFVCACLGGGGLQHGSMRSEAN